MTSKDYVAIARQYEEAVVRNGHAFCKWTRLAIDRNQRDLARASAGDPTFPYRFDESAASRICFAAEQLPHIKGPKAKILGYDEQGRAIWATLELEPHQCWFLTTLFGWVHRGTGLRRFRVALYLVPRKNAKSTLGAVVACYMVAADGENGAECYSAATTRDQAKVVAEIVWEMAKRSPSYREFFGVKLGSKTTRSIEVPATASRFLPLSADAHTLDALNVFLAIIDELHAHKTRGVWDVLDTATGARLQPLLLALTTAGVEIGGICYDKVQYLHKVLEGTLDDDAFFGIEYTIDEGDDWRDERTWRKANPNYGVSVQPDDMARKAREAEHSPAAVNNFLTKHLNVWVRAESTYMPMREWIARGDPQLKIEDFKSYPCWIAVDLSEVRDIAATVAIFRPTPHDYAIFGRYYLPAKAVVSSPIAQMSGWVREHHIIETPGDQQDFQRIEDDILGWYDEFDDVKEIDFDRALAAQMGQNLRRRLEPQMGRDAADRFVITVPQNVETMNPAMQLVVGLTLSKHLVHDGNPALNWMFSNVVAEPNYKGEVYPRKAGGKDSPNKIDGPVAIYTGLSRASQATLAPPRRRGVARVWTPDGFQPVDGAHPEGDAHA